jgi:hypothetical protein
MDPGVYALKSDNSGIVVGGNFSSAGGVLASNICRWDGTAWSTIGPGLLGPVLSLAMHPQLGLCAGGGTSFYDNPYIAHWDGVSWSYFPGLPLGLNNGITTLFVYQGDLYSSGPYAYFPLARWDGTDWRRVEGPFYPTFFPWLQPFAERNGKLLLAGRLNNVMSPPPDAGSAHYGIAEFDGQQWRILGAGLHGSEVVRSLAVLGDDVIAGGHFSREVHVPGNNELVARWNGQIWSPLDGGHAFYCSSCATLALATDSSSRIYLGGSFNPLYVVGTNWWTPDGAPVGVRAITTDSAYVYAGGDFGILRWDGTNWLPPGGGIFGTVYSLAARGSELFAGGNFTNAGGLTITNIARWDGANWQSLGAGLSDSVYALAFRGANLIAGGAFTNAGEVPLACIGSWDGMRWTSLGSGLTDGLATDFNFHPVQTAVNALSVSPEGLIYAAGNFTNADFKAANFIAYWDGGSWEPLGSGLDQVAYALASKGEDLYVGGDFAHAGGKPSSRIALWHGDASLLRPRLHVETSNGQAVVSWSTSATGFVLEASQELLSGSWSEISSTVAGGENRATNSMTGSSRFYRLHKQ